MPRTLTFNYRGAELGLVPEKLNRGKLYGSVEVEALDDRGRRCQLATLSTDGRTLIGLGGTATGFLSPEGRWLERATLKAVNVNGQPLEGVESSFKTVTPLVEKVTVEQYLAHNIKAVYVMSGDEAALAPLAEELRAGAIYSFAYSFRGGLVADVGFLLAGQDDAIFLAVGQPTQLHFLGLEQLPAYEEEGETGAEEEDLDFGML